MEIEKEKLVENVQQVIKRKLSIGIAIIGNPKLILLDEPTFGSKFFNYISKINKD